MTQEEKSYGSPKMAGALQVQGEEQQLGCPPGSLWSAQGPDTSHRHLGSNLLLFCLLRYPHSSATFLVASKKGMNLPILFQVPDVLSKVLNYFLIKKKPEAINSSRMTKYEYKVYLISLTQPWVWIILRVQQRFLKWSEWTLPTPAPSCPEYLKAPMH